MTLKQSLLDAITTPVDLRSVNEKDLPQVADELRAETISAVAVTGGHLGAGLGVVELTVALHYVFNTPDDRIIMDLLVTKDSVGENVASATGDNTAGPWLALQGNQVVVGYLRQGSPTLTAYRTDTARRILDEVRITVLRGNAGEVATLVGADAEVRGVESIAAGL